MLERLSAEHPISVTTLDLASSEGQRLAWQGRVMFSPAIFIDEEPFSYGRPSEKRLRRELERRAGGEGKR